MSVMTTKLGSLFSKTRDGLKIKKAKGEKPKRELIIDESYNPFEFRSKLHQLTTFEAAMALIKGTIGPGIIAMPHAFNMCGYVPAILTLLIYPVVFVYCTHMLINAMTLLCKYHRTPLLSYADAMRLGLKIGPPVLHHFSNISVIFIDSLLVIYHFCVATVYIIYIASMMQNMIEDYFVTLDTRLLMIVLIVPLIPIFTIKTLKNMVPMWTFANALLIISISIIINFLLRKMPDIKYMHAFERPIRYAESFGFFLFTLQSMGTLLPIEAKMKDPKKFLGWKGLLVNVHIFIVLLCLILGFLGSWRFSSDIEENIIMNLTERTFACQVIRMFCATSLYLSYPLQASVVINNVWYHWLYRLITEQDRQPLEFVMRIIVVLLSATMAVCLVNLMAIVPLTGSLCISLLGIVFPALLNICINYNYGFGKLNWILLKDLSLILLGIVAGLMGATASVRVIFIEMRFF